MTHLCYINVFSLLKDIMKHIKNIQRINPNPENRFSQPILKIGLVFEGIMKPNAKMKTK